MKNNRFLLALAVSGALAFGVAACGDDENSADSGSGGTSAASDSGGAKLSGEIAGAG